MCRSRSNDHIIPLCVFRWAFQCIKPEVDCLSDGWDIAINVDTSFPHKYAV